MATLRTGMLPDDVEIPYVTDRPAAEQYAATFPGEPSIARFVTSKNYGTGMIVGDAMAELQRYAVLIECGRGAEIAYRVEQRIRWRLNLLQSTETRVADYEALVEQFMIEDACEAAVWTWLRDPAMYSRYDQPQETPLSYAAHQLLTKATGPFIELGTRQVLFSPDDRSKNYFLFVMRNALQVVSSNRNTIVLPAPGLYQPIRPAERDALWPTRTLPWPADEAQEESNRITREMSKKTGETQTVSFQSRLNDALNPTVIEDTVTPETPYPEHVVDARMLMFLLTYNYSSRDTLLKRGHNLFGAGFPRENPFPEQINNELKEVRKAIQEAKNLRLGLETALIPASYNRVSNASEIKWLIDKNGNTTFVTTPVVDRGGAGDCFYQSFFDGLQLIQGKELSPGSSVSRQRVSQLRKMLLDYLSQNFLYLEYNRLDAGLDIKMFNSQLLTLSSQLENTFGQSCISFKKLGEWADTPEVVLASEAFDVDIFIVTNMNGDLNYARIVPSDTSSNGIVFLYNSNATHYQLILPENLGEALEQNG